MARTAEDIELKILSGEQKILVKDSISVDKVSGNNITIKKDTVSERDFIAAEDLRDSVTGDIIYKKGDIIPEGTEFKGNWLVEDLRKSEVIQKVDEEGHKTDLDPDTEEEVKTGSQDTNMGLDRRVDNLMYVNYDDIEEFSFGYIGEGEYMFSVDEGDDLVCLGHLYETTRQNAIVLSADRPIDSDLVGPAIAQYNNIDMFDPILSKYRMAAMAANGNEFIGSFLINYNNTYMDINERINLFINDLETGLESVGIHLDGEASTIRLVGSVDLKQHSSDSYDTLSVYDNLNTKRIEISPFDIAKRNSTQSGIDITKKHLYYVSDYKTAPKSYISYDKWRHWWNIFSYSWKYKYTIKNYSVSSTSSINLGYLEKGNVIDLSKLNLTYYAAPYLVGGIFMSNRGTNEQKVTTLTYTIKRNGKAIPEYNKINLLKNNNLIINGINTENVTATISSTFVDDYTISTAGTYSIEFTMAMSLYATYEGFTKYNNYYIKFNTGFSGNVTLSVSKNAVGNEDVSGRKLSIGTNGLSFVGNNSRYFYAATDGYEMKWDDISLKIDSNGLYTNRLYQVRNEGGYLDRKYDIIICNYSSEGYTITLPDAQEFGNGRTITIIGFQGLKIYTRGNDKVRIPQALGVYEGDVIELGETKISGSIHMSKYNVQLISANAGWYITSYM